MSARRKQAIHDLLKGIETGDPHAVDVIHPETYIQHNPQTHEGRKGLAALFARLAKTSPRVNLVRLFSDGDYVFGHTEYDFSTRRIGFEVFRFEGDHAVEHWDNIQPRRGPNPAGRTMVDGPTDATSLNLTEVHRARVRDFVETIRIDGALERLEDYVSPSFAEHDPTGEDGREALRARLAAGRDGRYLRIHRILAEGDFVLAVSEGHHDGRQTAFYDLYRLADNMLVEHWNTVEHVAPQAEWKNDNGKF